MYLKNFFVLERTFLKLENSGLCKLILELINISNVQLSVA